jgi:hypothetical protein
VSSGWPDATRSRKIAFATLPPGTAGFPGLGNRLGQLVHNLANRVPQGHIEHSEERSMPYNPEKSNANTSGNLPPKKQPSAAVIKGLGSQAIKGANK